MGPQRGGEAEGADPAPDVPDRDPGDHREPGHRARDDSRHAQERSREVLRRRHHPEAKTPGEAARRKEAHEAGRNGPHSTRGVSRGAARRALGRVGGDSMESARAAGTKSRRATRTKSTLREYVEAVVLAILLTVVIRGLVVQDFGIPTA